MKYKDNVFHPVRRSRNVDLVEAKDMKYKPTLLLGDASEAITMDSSKKYKV